MYIIINIYENRMPSSPKIGQHSRTGGWNGGGRPTGVNNLI